MATRRVVVTGMGLVTPIGNDVEEFWENLLHGKSGAAEISSFDTSAFNCRIGCEVKDFDAEKYLGARANRYGRVSQMAITASQIALNDAALDLDSFSLERIGVAMGTTVGGLQVLEKSGNDWYLKGVTAFDGELIVQSPCHIMATDIADELGLMGPNVTLATACSSGNHAIAEAFEIIRSNRADLMLAGGADVFSKISFIGFSRLRVMAPERCQPFDKNRKGLILGEGAGVLLLEDFETATKRGAQIYAEILGSGLSCDAYHITTPHPEGKGVAMAMAMALEKAQLKKSDVHYINAHGTGTIHNDKSETRAIKQVFGPLAYDIPVSSTKALTGHLMGTASAVEAIVCVLSLQKKVVPPTWNYETPDPECDLDFVPNQEREVDVKVALNLSSAFGGTNACVIFGRV